MASSEPLHRTTSNDSVSSRRRNSHSLSAAANSFQSNRKGRVLDPTLSSEQSESAITSPEHAAEPSTDAPLAMTLDLLREPLSTSGPDGTKLSEAALQRRSDPEIEPGRLSGLGETLYNYGAGLYTGMKEAYISPKGSVSGLSEGDQTLRQVSSLPEGRLSADSGARREATSDAVTTTATTSLAITTQSQNGALFPGPNQSGRDPFIATNGSLSASPSSPPSGMSRTVQPRPTRGRTPGNSRRVSGSFPNSASNSAERSIASDRNPNRIGTIGICALDAKARSKPSRNILNRLVGKDQEFDVTIFGDKVILDENVENWPVCDFLISFFSDGFPLEKAIAYAKLRKPFCVNDLPMQTVLWDRRMCLMILGKLGVPTPPRVEVNRDGGSVLLSTDIAKRLYELTGLRLPGSADGRGGGEPEPTDVHMEDDDDTLVVDGQRLSKPFVEKPVNGEDHNVYIYYPRSQGGGGRRLFRKINNKSSEKDESLIIPRCFTEKSASYIYEQFVKVENAEDVKAYTVGPDFCHAETRKSPVVDGLVKRNPNGKEVRYVTSLSKEEQVMAAKIADGFGQRICGFDLLRVEDKSYVIDVNGWSFVKDNNEYYDKCASILKSIFYREKLRWEGKATPSESDENDSSRQLPGGGTMTPEPSGPGFPRKSTIEKDKSTSHRKALKSVFRSRSISQLRDHARDVVHGHHRSVRESFSSSTTSPLSSPPSYERNLPLPKRSGSLHPDGPLIARSVPDVTSGLASRVIADDDRSLMSDAALEKNLTSHSEEPPSSLPAPASKSQWKLKGMVAVIRHADRTPKQKMKFTFHTKPFVDLLKGHQEEVLLVGEAALKSVQLAVEEALASGEEDTAKLTMLRNVLVRKGGLPGTKVQIKPMFRKPKKDHKDKKKEAKDNGQASEERKSMVAEQEVVAKIQEAQEVVAGEKGGVLQDQVHPKDFPEEDAVRPTQARAQTRSDSVSEVTMSRTAAAENHLQLDKLQLVMKWGGEPTHSARYQATDLGENMRNDLLLMNRDVLSDVTMFTSSERRVTTSAQIFASAFLDDNNLPSDFCKVRKDLLDDSNAAKDEMDRVKKRLKGLLRKGYEAPAQFAWPKDGTPEPYLVVRNVVELMKFHRRVMRDNFSRMPLGGAVGELKKLHNPSSLSLTSETSNSNAGKTGTAGIPPNPTDGQYAQATSVQTRWCTGEDAELFKERWEKLFNEFTDAEKVDPSKTSELYDTMKFDALHNRQFLEWVFTPSRALIKDMEKEYEDEETQRQKSALAEAMTGGVGLGLGDDDGERLSRTESMVAREEFEQTHGGRDEPKIDDSRDQALITPDEPPSQPQHVKTNSSTRPHRPSVAQRMGFRRRSAEVMSAAKSASAGPAPPPATAGSNQLADSPGSSYFNLFTGTHGGGAKEDVSGQGESTAKSDSRLQKLNELYSQSKILFDFIGPQEYGITDTEKLEIGLLTSLPLLKEIVKDLEDVQASDDAKSFIYFTKESHIYTLLNCILEGGIHTKIARNAIPELDYLSQICFELYESANTCPSSQNEGDESSDENDPFNYSIRITISPGCHTFDPLDVQLDSKHCIGCAPRRSLTAHGQWKEVIETLRAKFHTVKLPKSFLAVNLSEKVPQEFAKQEGDTTVAEAMAEASPIALAH